MQWRSLLFYPYNSLLSLSLLEMQHFTQILSCGDRHLSVFLRCLYIRFVAGAALQVGGLKLSLRKVQIKIYCFENDA